MTNGNTMTKPLLLTALGVVIAATLCFAASGASAGAVRDLAWSGGAKLGVSVPATVHFTQGPTSAVHISGPQEMVEHVTMRDGDLRFDRPRMFNLGRLEITLTAPDVTRFVLSGSQKLDVRGYRQSQLDASISGSGGITVHGFADRASLSISGSGDIDAGSLATREATVKISGSGDVTAAPTEQADIRISGSGNVTLKTRTARVQSRISGSGKVVQDP
jgi:hypothetical protein